jgi:hypothetical protein
METRLGELGGNIEMGDDLIIEQELNIDDDKDNEEKAEIEMEENIEEDDESNERKLSE